MVLLNYTSKNFSSTLFVSRRKSTVAFSVLVLLYTSMDIFLMKDSLNNFNFIGGIFFSYMMEFVNADVCFSTHSQR